MDQTVDILGLCDDTVGYSKTEEIENKPHTTLENNLVFEASKQEVGIYGFNSKASSEDKKHLVYNNNSLCIRRLVIWFVIFESLQ